MGQITATRNLDATKVVRHAGQIHHFLMCPYHINNEQQEKIKSHFEKNNNNNSNNNNNNNNNNMIMMI